jgi:DNA (cytosine-5)-methyltransferase 1
MPERNSFTVVDLFCAPGGLTLGFEMAGFTSLLGVDKDSDGMVTYHRNFPKAGAITADIKEEMDSERLMNEAGIGKGQVDVIIGGPPCQGFSNIGRVKIASLVREGVWNLSTARPRFIDDPRNVLYKEFVRIVRDLRPKFFIMENVPGMKSYRNGEIVDEIIEDFNTAGYFTDSRVLDAVEYGVPQKRKRIFFIGTRLKAVKISWPRPTHFNSDAGITTLDQFVETSTKGSLNPCVTVWEAIGGLPDPVPGRHGLGDVPLDYDRPVGENEQYARWARSGSDKVHNHITRQHSTRDVRVFSIMEEGMWWKDLPEEAKKLYGYRDDIFHDKMKRLYRKKPSWTVVAHLYKDGYMYIHPIQPRSITVREAARLQSFPDRFIFMASRTSQFRQVGNAVPPLLSKAVATKVREMLEKALP